MGYVRCFESVEWDQPSSGICHTLISRHTHNTTSVLSVDVVDVGDGLQSTLVRAGEGAEELAGDLRWPAMDTLRTD